MSHACGHTRVGAYGLKPCSPGLHARGRGAAAIFAAALAALLASCSSRVALEVRTESPRLRDAIAKLAAEYPPSRGLRLTLAKATEAESREAPKTVVSIGWAFPDAAGAPAPTPIPEAEVAASGFITSLAVQRWETGSGAWHGLPLLWDAYGVASTPEKVALLGQAKTFVWADRAVFAKAKIPIEAPLGDPGLRQALFWSESAGALEPEAISDVMLGGKGRETRLDLFKEFSVLGLDVELAKGSAVLTKGDIDNVARTAGASLILGDYQWVRPLPMQGRMDFRSLAYPLSQGYAMPAAIIEGRVYGQGKTLKAAQEFLLWLAQPERQRELSAGTGYMAANFGAINLDPNGKAARDAALGAASIVPIDPEPVKGSAADAWDLILRRILAEPAKWQDAVAGK